MLRGQFSYDVELGDIIRNMLGGFEVSCLPASG